MNKAFEQAIEKVRSLSDERQRYAAEVLEQIAAAGDGVYQLSDDERRLVREGLDELDRGEAATEDEVRAVFDKYRSSSLSMHRKHCAISIRYSPTSNGTAFKVRTMFR